MAAAASSSSSTKTTGVKGNDNLGEELEWEEQQQAAAISSEPISRFSKRCPAGEGTQMLLVYAAERQLEDIHRRIQLEGRTIKLPNGRTDRDLVEQDVPIDVTPSTAR